MADVTLSPSFIDGSVLRAKGWIHMDNWESESGKLTISAIPRDNRWSVFAGQYPDTVGTMRGMVINGVPYRTSGDCNVAVPPGYKNEAQETSGANMRKMTKQARAITGIVLVVNLTEYETLRTLADTP
jgi:hypothetical protein